MVEDTGSYNAILILTLERLDCLLRMYVTVYKQFLCGSNVVFDAGGTNGD